MNYDDTHQMPQPPPPRERHPDRYERWLLVWLAIAYLFAGMVLGYACVTLANVADQINSTPFCRRI